MRVKDLEKPLVKNTGKLRCSDCREMVWISPATQQVAEQTESPILCNVCVMKLYEN